MGDILNFTGENLMAHNDKGDLTPTGKQEALEMMQKCVNMIQGKIDAGDIEGLILIMFNKEGTPMDYFAGSIKMKDLSFTLQTMIHKIHSDVLINMEEYND
tara:strand:+ start:603 stop:905 length:303 start_codon:yes stop_codon:yes gene_type:complete